MYFVNSVWLRDLKQFTSGRYDLWARQIFFSPNFAVPRVIPNLGNVKTSLITVSCDWLDKVVSGNQTSSPLWFTVEFLSNPAPSFDEVVVNLEKPTISYWAQGFTSNSGNIDFKLFFTDEAGLNCSFLATNDITIQAQLVARPRPSSSLQPNRSFMKKKGDKSRSKILSSIPYLRENTKSKSLMWL